MNLHKDHSKDPPIRLSRDRERRKIQRLTAEFLASGKEVEVCAPRHADAAECQGCGKTFDAGSASSMSAAARSYCSAHCLRERQRREGWTVREKTN